MASAASRLPDAEIALCRRGRERRLELIQGATASEVGGIHPVGEGQRVIPLDGVALAADGRELEGQTGAGQLRLESRPAGTCTRLKVPLRAEEPMMPNCSPMAGAKLPLTFALSEPPKASPASSSTPLLVALLMPKFKVPLVRLPVPPRVTSV